MRTPLIATRDREGYAQHAAMESILVYIDKAHAELAEVQREIIWLNKLLATRARQMSQGLWPPAKAVPGA